MVSVIIPTYNCERYVCDAIDSVLAQTYIDSEILVVDDGSTDDTKNILRKYNGRIRYFFHENRGLPSARNTGIKNASGEFIAFLDADDIWMSTKLEETLNWMREASLDFVFTDFLVFNEYKILSESGLSEKIIGLEIAGKRRGVLKDAMAKLIRQGFIMPSTVVVTKKLLDSEGLFDETIKYNEDRDLFLRIAKRFQMGFINIPLAKRRKHSASMTSSPDKMYGWELTMFERILVKITDLNRCERETIKRQKAVILYEWGYYYYGKRLYKIAREKFFLALLLYVTPKTIFYWFTSCLPDPFLNFLRYLKQRRRLYARS